MKLKITIILVFFFQLYALYSQELRVKVNIDAQQITNVEPSVFVKMQTDVEEFLNFRKWTSNVYSEQEKIKCSINITLESQNSQGVYSGSIFVLSSRPIYNTVYNSTIYKVLDNDFVIKYDDFSIIEYNDNIFQSNFGSILAYYAYMMIGMDYDSFADKSGEDYFEKAMDVVRNAQGEDEYKSGWRSTASNENRYWMAENLLNPKYEKIRNFNKAFHLDILDHLHAGNPQLKTDLYAQVLELEDLSFFANSFLLRTFFEIKAEEIYNIAKDLDYDKQKEVKRIMSKLNATNKKFWNKLATNKKAKNSVQQAQSNNSGKTKSGMTSGAKTIPINSNLKSGPVSRRP